MTMINGDRLTVPGHLLSPRGGDHYVLRVVGDYMVEEGICDGDYVIILRRNKAEAGEMIVAIVGDDVTLKRFYPEGDDRVCLVSANRDKSTITLLVSDIHIQGVVVGLMRKF